MLQGIVLLGLVYINAKQHNMKNNFKNKCWMCFHINESQPLNNNSGKMKWEIIKEEMKDAKMRNAKR